MVWGYGVRYLSFSKCFLMTYISRDRVKVHIYGVDMYSSCSSLPRAVSVSVSVSVSGSCHVPSVCTPFPFFPFFTYLCCICLPHLHVTDGRALVSQLPSAAPVYAAAAVDSFVSLGFGVGTSYESGRMGLGWDGIGLGRDYMIRVYLAVIYNGGRIRLGKVEVGSGPFLSGFRTLGGWTNGHARYLRYK